MSDIVILRAALDALNGADHQASGLRPASQTAGLDGAPMKSDAATTAASRSMTATPVQRPFTRSDLVPEMLADAAAPLGMLIDQEVYFDDELDSESVRLLALKAQQQLSIQALAIANVRALSIIHLFRDDEPAIRLM